MAPPTSLPPFLLTAAQTPASTSVLSTAAGVQGMPQISAIPSTGAQAPASVTIHPTIPSTSVQPPATQILGFTPEAQLPHQLPSQLPPQLPPQPSAPYAFPTSASPPVLSPVYQRGFDSAQMPPVFRAPVAVPSNTHASFPAPVLHQLPPATQQPVAPVPMYDPASFQQPQLGAQNLQNQLIYDPTIAARSARQILSGNLESS